MGDQLPLLGPAPPLNERRATLSPDGLYRYDLARRWRADGPTLLWVMLNPSTADGAVDDPTIRRICGYSERFGAASLIVVNLFAFRATDPRALVEAHRAGRDIVGPYNDAAIGAAAAWASDVVLAWGRLPRGLSAHRPAIVRAILARAGHRETLALTLTKSGQPGHPLYLPSELVPRPESEVGGG